MPNSPLILGIDLGLSSLGLAVIDARNQKIVFSNVHVFGSEGDAKDRREKRALRKQIRRRKRRIRQLFHLLIDEKLLPISRVNLRRNIATLPLLAAKGKQPENEDQIYLQKLMELEPWSLRKKALEGEKLTTLEWVRVLLHFAKRRGFPEGALRKVDEETERKVLNEGDPVANSIGALQTQQAIEKAEVNHLGYLLAKLLPPQGEPYQPRERIRNRYTYRSMYQAEFKAICEAQRLYQPHLFRPAFTAQLYHLLFSQLPLLTPPRGRCTFEAYPTYYKKRARTASLLFEQYRMYAFLNNFITSLDKQGYSVTSTQRERLVDHYLHREKVTVKALKKLLGIPGPYSEYEKKHEITAMPVTSMLYKLFGKKVWEALSEKEKEDRWHIIYQLQDEPEKLIAYAQRTWSFNDKQLARLAKAHWAKQTANVSIKAIRCMLSWLQQGFTYDKAAILGSIPKAFGHRLGDASEKSLPNHWISLSATVQETILQDAVNILRQQPAKAFDHIKEYLQANYPTQAYALHKIYQPTQVDEAQQERRLPNPLPTRNPSVDRALFALRRQVNALMEHLKIEKFSVVRIELARELKKSAKERATLASHMNKQQEENDAAYAYLLNNGIVPTPYNIKKYRLWREASFYCIYSAQPISAAMFKEAEIEHIRPVYPQDSSWNNLTIASKEANALKQKRTPYEAFGKLPQWEAIKQLAKKCFSPEKYRHFINTDSLERVAPPLTQREGDLTGYITKQAAHYVKQIADHVEVTQGGVVSLLRQNWKLNSLLQPKFPLPNEKQPLPIGSYWVAYTVEANNPSTHPLLPRYKLLDYCFFQPTEGPGDLQAVERTTAKAAFEEKLKKNYGGKGKGVRYHCSEALIKTSKDGQTQFFTSVQKNRTDHRHHLIDACVIAATELSYSQYINRQAGQGEEVSSPLTFPIPWEGFTADLAEQLKKVVITFQPKKSLIERTHKRVLIPNYPRFGAKPQKPYVSTIASGTTARTELHKATFYGYRKTLNGRGELQETNYRYRVPIASIEKLKQANTIVDPAIRAIVKERLQIVGKGKDPFWEIKKDGRTLISRTPTLFLPNKRLGGAPVPIKRIRVFKTSSKMIQLSSSNGAANRYVEPSNNWIAAIYLTPAGRWVDEVIPALEAAKLLSRAIPFPAPRNAAGYPLVFSLQKNELVLLLPPHIDDPRTCGQETLSPYVYRVQKVSQSIEKGRLKPGDYTFRHHTAATLDNPMQSRTFTCNTLQKANPIKLQLDSIGRIKNFVFPSLTPENT